MPKLIKSNTEFELSPTLQINELVVKKRKEGGEVLHMGFGQAPFPVVPELQEALKLAVHRKEYLPTYGLPELCKAIADYYKTKTGLDADKYDIIVAPGSKLVIYALQMAVEGDLIMPVPSWVSYAPQSLMLNRNVIKCPTVLDDDGYHLDAKTLSNVITKAREEGKNPSKIILNYPNNPTGLKIPENELEAIANVCIKEDILIISDEIYGLVSFDNKYTSISKYAPNHTAITTGLSKHLSLGGWRLGIGLIPKEFSGLYSLLKNIASETWSCTASPIQQASVAAYKNNLNVENAIKEFGEIHCLINKYIASGLKKLGIECPMPQGAFYTYPNFKNYQSELGKIGIKTSKDLASYLLNNYSLASLPGVAFGEEPEVLTLRLSGCDYDGEKTWQAYQKGETLNEAFIAKNAPRVVKAIDAFTAFIKEIKSK